MTVLERFVPRRIPLKSDDMQSRKVWDLPVRVFHSALVTAFIGALVTNRRSVGYFRYHLWFGYAVIVLVSFRIFWGLVGTRHALFKNFVCGPAETLSHAMDLLRHRLGHPHVGHNPLGTCMVVALLLALGIQAGTGLFGDDEILNVGPLAGTVAKETSLWLTSLHRHLFYWILAAVVIHVLVVIAHHLIGQRNLVRAMITGHKPQDHVPEKDGIGSSRVRLAMVLIIALSAGLALIVTHAPAPVEDSSVF